MIDYPNQYHFTIDFGATLVLGGLTPISTRGTRCVQGGVAPAKKYVI